MISRRQCLAMLGSTAASIAQSASLPIDIVQAEGWVPITGTDGNVAFRFKAFSGAVELRLTSTLRIRMACIPAGSGMMGSELRSPVAPLRLVSTPVHEVKVQGFLLAIHEVTVGQWMEVAQLPEVRIPLNDFGPGVGSQNDSLNWPMQIGVSLDQVEEFCARLRQLSGLEFRPPSETEWEYACRAGTSTWYHFGDSFGSNIDLSAVVPPIRGVPVMYRNAPNRFGLHEMHSATGEWCADAEFLNYEGSPADGSARPGPGERSGNHIIRGGYLLSGSAGRFGAHRGSWADLQGFRLALSFAHGIRDPRIAGPTPTEAVASPGQAVTLGGDFLTPTDDGNYRFDPSIEDRLPDTAQGTAVYYGDDAKQLRLVQAAPNRVSFLIPTSAIGDGHTQRIVVRSGMQSSAPVTLAIRSAFPRLWNEGEKPTDLRRGSVVELLGSGFGSLAGTKAYEDGTIFPLHGEGALPAPLLPPEATISGVVAPIELCEQARGFPLGIMRLAIRVPEDAPIGEQELVFRVGSDRGAAATVRVL